MADWTRRTVLGGIGATLLPLAGRATETTGESITLEAAESRLRLLPKPAEDTAVWAYNGTVPGPLLRVKRGAEVKVRLVNKLAQPTSLCWHGVRITNSMDGVAGLTQEPVKPGASFDYAFTPPDAGLYWYHPHVFPQSPEQIARGLYGLLLVEEPDPPAVDQDLLLVLDDWALDAKGQIASGAAVGERLVQLNGQTIPAAPIELRPGARVRLRFLNACAGRIALVSFAAGHPLVVALDGQPSEVFPPVGNTLPIGPGSRFEVILDLPPDSGKELGLLIRDPGMKPDAGHPLIAFKTKGDKIAAKPAVAGLTANPLLPTRIPLEKSLKKDLVIAQASGAPWQWTLGGQGSDGFSSKPIFTIKRGGAVTLAFVNKTPTVQQMHVHGHVFRILHDLDDGWDPYWRESILIGPGRTKHIAFIADNPGKWAVESLFPDRQVTGLAGWFEVT